MVKGMIGPGHVDSVVPTVPLFLLSAVLYNGLGLRFEGVFSEGADPVK